MLIKGCDYDYADDEIAQARVNFLGNYVLTRVDLDLLRLRNNIRYCVTISLDVGDNGRRTGDRLERPVLAVDSCRVR